MLHITDPVPNPLSQDGFSFMRLVATPSKGVSVHDDVTAPTIFNVGIEFGSVTQGKFEISAAHSYAMTEDVMDLGEGQARGLRETQVAELFERFKAGQLKSHRPIAA